ncbi:Antirestriction protein [marine gamma proteobacterium HTCC2148]|jgi:hypothetical protein|nr:Antirestriction protein [marine gamma proteobacterium HTCC2148]
MTNTAIETTINRNLIADQDRLNHVEKLFGIHFPFRLEPVIYDITERMAPTYRGGYWNFYRLNSGGFYMAPEGGQTYQVSCDNYWSGELSADALGIAACLYAYSHLSFGGPEEFARQCARHYHLLREYMCEHSEVEGILGAVD